MKLVDAIRGKEGKASLRALVHRGVKSQRISTVAHRAKALRGETMCERCGNVYRGKRWLAGTKGEWACPVGFSWTVCPACRQTEAREYYGRVLVRGERALDREAEVRARVENVAARARFTQPQRRIVSIERRGDELEILTTSQKLAHRVVNCLIEAFGGEGTFSWSSDDGELAATWTWNGTPRLLDEDGERGRGERVPNPDIRCRHVSLEPAWRDRIERSVEQWAMHGRGPMRVQMTLTHGGHHRHGVEDVTANVSLPGRKIRATKTAGTMAAAIREALSALERKLDTAREERRDAARRPVPRRASKT